MRLEQFFELYCFRLGGSAVPAAFLHPLGTGLDSGTQGHSCHSPSLQHRCCYWKCLVFQLTHPVHLVVSNWHDLGCSQKEETPTGFSALRHMGCSYHRLLVQRDCRETSTEGKEHRSAN